MKTFTQVRNTREAPVYQDIPLCQNCGKLVEKGDGLPVWQDQNGKFYCDKCYEKLK